jgi:hypothetical protein
LIQPVFRVLRSESTLDGVEVGLGTAECAVGTEAADHRETTAAALMHLMGVCRIDKRLRIEAYRGEHRGGIHYGKLEPGRQNADHGEWLIADSDG